MQLPIDLDKLACAHGPGDALADAIDEAVLVAIYQLGGLAINAMKVIELAFGDWGTAAMREVVFLQSLERLEQKGLARSQSDAELN